MLHLRAGFEALAGKYVGFCADFVFHRKLGRLFDAPDHAVELALDRTGRLVRHGLVEPKWSCTPALVHRLRLLPGLINALVSPAKSTDDFFAAPAVATRSTLADSELLQPRGSQNVLKERAPNSGQAAIRADPFLDQARRSGPHLSAWSASFGVIHSARCNRGQAAVSGE